MTTRLEPVWRTVPVDTGPNFSDSTLPLAMIEAGMAVQDQVADDNANYVAGETTDWDQGMVAVAIYRAMLSAAPAPEGMLEAIEVVTEWLAMAKETPKPLHSSLNYVPICASEFEAIERILALLAAKGEGRE